MTQRWGSLLVAIGALGLAQLGARAIVPLNHEGGRGVGFRAQLLFFLDEVSPLFAKPLFSSQPVVSRVEKFSN